MPIILAIETSTELASVALLQDDRILTRESSSVQTHSESLLPMARQLLDQAGIALAACDAVAFGAGPGSFTGVRTACGLAQGLAFGARVPVVPIVTLEAMAEACRAVTGADEVLAVLDARMGEVYWAQYRYDGAWHAVVEPALAPAAQVVPVGSPVACGNGLAVYPEAFPPAFRERIVQSRRHAQLMPHAAQVALLARQAVARGATLAARDARPFYLRNKVALTSAERLAKAAP
jgi:tRNA threonylcarbamoyladenosine biosynthesis protein TsaB